MLTDKLRAGAQGRVFKFLFWIIILSFVLTGVGGYLIPRMDTDPVKVGDYRISANEWTQQFQRESQRLQQIYGSRFSDLMDNQDFANNMRRSVLERMVDNVAVNATVYDMGIRIGDPQIKDYIRQDQTFFKDGKFDNDLYLASVRNMGMSPDYYAEQLRTALMSGSVTGPALNAGSEVMPYESSQMIELFTQTRSVDLVRLSLGAVRAGITVSDEDARRYDDAHHGEFMAPATVQFNYLLLSVDDLKRAVKVEDSLLEDYYNQHQDEFEHGEEREASHIVIRPGDEAAAQIEKVTAGIAAGEDFAKLAREYSSDLAAREDGGRMGVQTRESLAPNLAEALYGLKAEGEVSAPVVDDFGTHFIRLDKIIPAQVPPFARIKDEVRTAYVNEEATRQFNEKITTLSDLTFENPDSLDPAAEALGLKVIDSGAVKFQDAQAPWPLNTPEVQKVAFDAEVQSSGTNSQVIAVGQDTAVAINVLDHKDSVLRELAEVTALAREKALNEQVSIRAHDILSEYAKVRQGNAQAELPQLAHLEENVVLGRQSNDYDPQFLQAVFAIPREGEARWVIASNKDEPVLAFLKGVARDEGVNEEMTAHYEKLVSAQLSSLLREKLDGMINRSARSLNDIEFDEDNIRLINQSNHGE